MTTRGLFNGNFTRKSSRLTTPIHSDPNMRTIISRENFTFQRSYSHGVESRSKKGYENILRQKSEIPNSEYRELLIEGPLRPSDARFSLVNSKNISCMSISVQREMIQKLVDLHLPNLTIDNDKISLIDSFRCGLLVSPFAFTEAISPQKFLGVLTTFLLLNHSRFAFKDFFRVYLYAEEFSDRYGIILEQSVHEGISLDKKGFTNKRFQSGNQGGKENIGKHVSEQSTPNEQNKLNELLIGDVIRELKNKIKLSLRSSIDGFIGDVNFLSDILSSFLSVGHLQEYRVSNEININRYIQRKTKISNANRKDEKCMIQEQWLADACLSLYSQKIRKDGVFGLITLPLLLWRQYIDLRTFTLSSRVIRESFKEHSGFDRDVLYDNGLEKDKSIGKIKKNNRLSSIDVALIPSIVKIYDIKCNEFITEYLALFLHQIPEMNLWELKMALYEYHFYGL